MNRKQIRRTDSGSGFSIWNRIREIYRRGDRVVLFILHHSFCRMICKVEFLSPGHICDKTVTVSAYQMPKAKEYGCSIICFIIDKDNSLKEEPEGQEKDSASILEFRYMYWIDEVER